MPIIEVHMVPAEFREAPELQARLRDLVSSYPSLSGIRPDEVMVNIIPGAQRPASAHFLYARVWMYRREGRSREILAPLGRELSRAIFEHFSTHLPMLDMVEVLPFELVDPADCFVAQLGSR